MMAHGFIFFANITLYLLARPILKLIDPQGANDSKVRIFKTLNIIVFVLHLVDIVLLGANQGYQPYFINIGYTIMLIYGALLVYSLLCAQSRKRFGKVKTLDEKKLYLESYSSRLVDLIVLIFIVLATIYGLIKIWGADSLLEATGIYAILAAFLAFTSNSWAPDIISGLIILNTEILEDGDVVVIDGYKDEYVISRVTLIYVVLYDIRNNNRTLLRNSQFIERRIDNLSRVASSNGIRQALTYNIGYPEFTGDKESRKEQLAAFNARVSSMFSEANQVSCDDDKILINPNVPFEWSMTNAGDYALEYTLWIYLSRVPNSKITATLRRYLMGTVYRVNEAVYAASVAENIDLSTPDVHQISLSSAQPESKPVKS